MSNFTFTILKPDALQSKQEGKIINAILEAGFQFIGMKLIHISKRQAEDFYAIHKERPFYGELVAFMTSGPVIVAALKKDNAVLAFRELIGATDPLEAKEGTIRKRFAASKAKNAVHGSDSDANAKNEIQFFFTPQELLQ